MTHVISLLEALVYLLGGYLPGNLLQFAIENGPLMDDFFLY